MPGATAYFGSVGKDEYAEKLREAATAGGVHVSNSAEKIGLSYLQAFKHIILKSLQLTLLSGSHHMQMMSNAMLRMLHGRAYD